MSLINQFKEAWGTKALKMAKEREKEVKIIKKMVFNKKKYESRKFQS